MQELSASLKGSHDNQLSAPDDRIRDRPGTVRTTTNREVPVIETIEIKNEQQWLEERLKDVTSTEVSALFNLSPYKTPFELYHEKRNGQVVSFKPNERMKWGTRFESAIAYGVAEDQGWTVQPMKVYMRDTEVRIGSSFDFEIISEEHGRGILEIKNVDSLQFKRKWRDDGAGGIEAPEHIELQIQHQMLVTGIHWCVLVAMVGGNTPKIVFRRFDPRVGDRIKMKVAEFWDSVDNGVAPSADYSRDADLIAQIYSQATDGEIFDAKGDAEIANLMSKYKQAKEQIGFYEKKLDEVKAQMLEKIGTASKVIGEWGSISCGRTKDSPGKAITADMVGTITGARKGYRMFTTNLKETENV